MKDLLEEFELALDEGIHDPHIFKAIFMAGPPGAGKNRVISDLGLSATGLKLLDIDKTLSYLAKNQPPVNPDYDRGRTVTMKQIPQFQKGMLGLLINTTGRNYEPLMALNKELKQAGYDTFMLFVDVNYDVAFQRIQDRAKHATNPADKRKVDLDYFETAYDDAKENAEFYALMFGNQFSYITNNVEDEQVVEAAGDEMSTEYQQSLLIASKKVNRFLKKPLTPMAQEIIAKVSSSSA